MMALRKVFTLLRMGWAASWLGLNLPLASLAVLIVLIFLACGHGSGSGGTTVSSSPPPPLRGPRAPDQIGIDYTPESRCSDSNWQTTTPAACNPQLSFICPSPNPQQPLNCPSACQTCYDNDLKSNLQGRLNVSTITSYQPNYYILKSADTLKIKVIQGLFNDAIPSLAKPSTAKNCTFSGSAISLCGSKYAGALLDGACGSVTPWDPEDFCSNTPTENRPYVEPLNYPDRPKKDTRVPKFIQDGTIIAIQLGNEALGTKVGGQVITAQMISTAAKTLRAALNTRGFSAIPIVVSLVLGQEKTFCKKGAPPPGVDFIAAHPYCNFVANTPPSWPLHGSQCWTQVQDLFKSVSQASCGASHTYIGETGYNTGCPNSVPQTTIDDERLFIDDLKSTTCAAPPPPSGFPTFLFAFSDVCPSSGCLAGCANRPREGNGYFGIFHTMDYLTKGDAVPKFPPPSLKCD